MIILNFKFGFMDIKRQLACTHVSTHHNDHIFIQFVDLN